MGRTKAEKAVSHAGNDARQFTSWPAYEAALKVAAMRYGRHLSGAEHGFHKDTTPRFDEKVAQSAWHRTLAPFNRTMRG